MPAPKPSKPPVMAFVWLGLAVLVCLIAAVVHLAPGVANGAAGAAKTFVPWLILILPVLLVVGVGIMDSVRERRDQVTEVPDDQLSPEQRELRRIGRKWQFDRAMEQARDRMDRR